MAGKFDAVPLDSDTVLLLSTEAMLDGIDVLYQKWIWEGIEAESFIFVTDDVSALSDESLEEFCRTSPMLEKESKMTIKRSSNGFDFVNFNFRVLEDEGDVVCGRSRKDE